MAFIRLIHRSDYNWRTGRFQDIAFKRPRGSTGISVIEHDCAIDASGSVCRHVEIFYPKHGSPTIFWPIPEDVLPQESRFEAELSDTGDNCHYNLVDISLGQADKVRKGIKVEECSICNDDGTIRQLTLDDLPPNVFAG